jgi:hypothetical protein
MNTLTALSPQQLRRAADIQEHIFKLQDELTALLGSPAEVAATIVEGSKQRKKFSAAARARMRQAQQERWAKIKGVKAPKKLEGKPGRKLSAAGRAAISAAAKERWAKARAAGKSTL